MADYLGDVLVGATINFTWDTNAAAGGSITRATDGTMSVYKDASATQSTAGVTDNEDDPDSLTGIHLATLVLTDSFYTPGSDYHVIVSGMTIDGQTVNATVARFSIQNRYYPGLIARGLMQAGSGATTAVLASATAFADDLINGATLLIVHGTGKGQSRLINDWASASDTATVDAWTTTPDDTSYYEVYATPPASSSVPTIVDVRKINNVEVIGAGTSGDKWRAA